MKKQRRCLKCQQLFESAHSGNRICPDCHNSNDQISRTNVRIPSMICIPYQHHWLSGQVIHKTLDKSDYT